SRDRGLARARPCLGCAARQRLAWPHRALRHPGDRCAPGSIARLVAGVGVPVDSTRSLNAQARTQLEARPVPAGDDGRAESTFERAKPLALALILTLGAVMGVRLLVELKTVLLLFFVAVLFAAALSRP